MGKPNLRYLQHRAEIAELERYYSLTENGKEYQYDREMAARLAVWARQRKAEGKTMLFREFYDQLSYYEQGAIKIRKHDGGHTFRY